MVKTTIYLDTDLAVLVKQLATIEGRPQAELIRQAVADYAAKHKRPSIPGVGEFDSGRTDTSERAEEILKRASRHGKWR